MSMRNFRVIRLLILTAGLAGCAVQNPVTDSKPVQTAAPDAEPTPSPFAQYPVQERAPTDTSRLRHASGYRHLASSDRLTKADIVGPDGIVYPDFSRAGLQQEPRTDLKTFRVEDFGAVADDAKDDAPGIQAAIDAAAEAGGGIVRMGKGTYHVFTPLTITANHTVLQGAGKEATTFHFDYKLEREEVRIVSPAEGQTLTRNDHIEVHSHPRRLETHILYVNGKELFRRKADTSGGERFSLVYPAIHMQPGTDTVEIKAVVERFDGTRTEAVRTVAFDPAPAKPGTQRFSHSVGAIQILGDSFTGRHAKTKITLTEPAKRGDTEVRVSHTTGLSVGDPILMDVKADEAFLAQTATARKDFHPKVMLQVKGLEKTKILLDRPLRMDFPGTPTLRKIYPVMGGGVEGFTFVQARKQWINAIQTHTVMNMRFRDLRIQKPGRNPLSMGMALHCELKDSEFGRPWFSGGGGTGYLGFSGSWECLIENINASELRHAPVIQAWASGNVFRKSRLVKSDANYHMLWAHENLIEQCEIDAARGSGSYGYAFFAQKPEVDIHGPGGGPRNVIYHNLTVSPRPAVYLGGSNENWIIAHNTFTVEKGPGMVFRNHSFDHIIWNNTLNIQDGSSPAFFFETADTPGIELVGNHVLGAGELTGGEGSPTLSQENIIGSEPDRPLPFPPSLYLWQKQQTER